MSKRKWSFEVTKKSDAMDLEEQIFESDDPAEIASSLKKSAERSHRRKAEPFRSAMAMLTFYINRAGKNLSSRRRSVLERAKGRLREAFGKDIDVAKAVIEEGTDDHGRKLRRHVGHHVADALPGGGYLSAGHIVLEINEHDGPARRGHGSCIVERIEFLDFAFDAVGSPALRFPRPMRWASALRSPSS